MDAGSELDGGMDAGTGNPCDSAMHDDVLGTLVLANGAAVVQSAPLPGNVFGVGMVNGSIYAVTFTNTLRQLGTLPTLTPGPELTSIIAPGDRDGGVRYGGGFVVGNGTALMTGYTRPGDFGGSVLIFETSDAGFQFVNAPGNYSAASINGSWLVNGLGLGAVSTANVGIYALDSQGPFGFTEFPAASSSGFTATTSEGVLLLGYYGTGANRLHATTVSTYAGPLANRASFALTTGTDLAIGNDVLTGVSAVGVNGLLLRSNAAYRPVRVEKLPLTTSGSGVITVTAGAPVTLVNSVDECTSLKFAVGAGNTFLLGVEDKNGERIIEVRP